MLTSVLHYMIKRIYPILKSMLKDRTFQIKYFMELIFMW